MVNIIISYGSFYLFVQFTVWLPRLRGGGRFRFDFGQNCLVAKDIFFEGELVFNADAHTRTHTQSGETLFSAGKVASGYYSRRWIDSRFICPDFLSTNCRIRKWKTISFVSRRRFGCVYNRFRFDPLMIRLIFIT